MLKILLLTVAALATLALLAVLAGQAGLWRGSPPADLGVRDGRLKPPSRTPNSVHSQAALWPDHPQAGRAAIAPLPFVRSDGGDGQATLARIEALVRATPAAELVRREPGYLYATYRSRLLRFTDDVEFWVDPAAGVVQVRSASRLGHGDRGVNRARIEAIRTALAR